MLLPIGLGMMAALSGLIARETGVTDPTRLRFGTALMLMIATVPVSVGSSPRSVARRT